MLSVPEKKILLAVARSAIYSALQNKTTPPITDTPENVSDSHGAFVTLRLFDELRGCIGYIESDSPLIETIQEIACKAAFNDPRFTPVRKEEVDSLEIEISVLSPIQEVKEISDIEVGKHGLIIQKGMQRGLLLPQVPLEYGWDREIFLNQTARKAGLSQNAWKQPGTKIFYFSAEVFSESEMQ